MTRQPSTLSPSLNAAVDIVEELYPNVRESVQTISKKKEHAEGRFLIWAILRAQGLSFPEIARTVGYADHSSIMNGVQRAIELHGRAGINRLALMMPPNRAEIAADRAQKKFCALLSARVTRSDSLNLPTDPKWALKVLKSELRKSINRKAGT